MERLREIPGDYAVVRLDPGDPIPDWVDVQGVVSITRTDRELSVLCPERFVPTDVKSEAGLACLAIDAALDFGVTGVIARLGTCLADAGIPVFVVSTFDTDLVFIRKPAMPAALKALARCGYAVPSK